MPMKYLLSKFISMKKRTGYEDFSNLGTYFNPSPPCLDVTLKHFYPLLNVVVLALQAGADVWITNGGQRTRSDLLRVEISEVEA